MKKKRIAILFSGGLDSTYLVYKALKDGHDVTPVYIEILNNPGKSTIEKQAIFQQFLVFKTQNKELTGKLMSPQLVGKMEVWKSWDSDLQFNQVPIWLLCIQYMDYRDFDEIQIGYVANDDANAFLSDISKTFKQLMWMRSTDGRPKAKLTFPLARIQKQEIIEELPYAFREHLYSCETPILLETKHKIEIPELDMNSQFQRTFLGNDEGMVEDYEVCGSCSSCHKIFTNEYLYDRYQSIHHTDYQKVQTKMTLRMHDKLLSEAKHDSRLKSYLDDHERRKTEGFEYAVKEEFKDVALVDKAEA